MNRRTFLSVAAAGSAVVAGCAGEDSPDDGDRTETDTPDGPGGDVETTIRLVNDHDRVWVSQMTFMVEPFESATFTTLDGSTTTLDITTLDELDLSDISLHRRATKVVFNGTRSRSRRLEADPGETVQETVNTWRDGGCFALVYPSHGDQDWRTTYWMSCLGTGSGVESYSVERTDEGGRLIGTSGGSCGG